MSLEVTPLNTDESQFSHLLMSVSWMLLSRTPTVQR